MVNDSEKSMSKKLTTLMAMGVALTMLAGCAPTKALLAKWDNGSLDYQTARQLPPIKLPVDQPAAPFVPLYAVPQVSTAPALQTGKRYELPMPPQTVPTHTQAIATAQ